MRQVKLKTMTPSSKEYISTLTEVRKLKNKVKSKKFINYIFNKTIDGLLYGYSNSYFIPISSLRIRKSLGKDFNTQQLDDLNIINRTNYSIKYHECRLYYINPIIFKNFLKIFYLDIANIVNSLITESKSIKYKPFNKIVKSKEEKYSLNKEPSIIVSSINSTGPIFFDILFIPIWLETLYLKFEEVFWLSASKNHKDNVLGNKLFRLQSSLLQSIYSVQKMIGGCYHVKSTVYAYYPEYKVQLGGRVSEVGGGFQMSPSVLKYFLTKRINYILGTKIYNFDIKDSHILCLIHILKKVDMGYSPFTIYLKEGKDKVSKKLRMNKKVWKRLLYAMCLGGNIKSKRGSLYKGVQIETDFKDHKKDIMIRKILRETEGIREVIKELSNTLVYKNTCYSYTHRGNKYWKNDVGKKFKEYYIKDNKLYNAVKQSVAQGGDVTKAKRRIMAFVIQGVESNFIHNLIVKLKSNGINVYSNEYDGFLSDNFKRELVNEVCKDLDIKLKLVKKDFCSIEEKDDVKKFWKNRKDNSVFKHFAKLYL